MMRVLTGFAIALTLVVVSSCQPAETTRADTATMIDCAVGAVLVSPANATLHPGDTLRVKAEVSSCLSPANEQVHWVSSDTSVAIVDSLAGFVRARGLGAASIIASLVSDRTQGAAMTLRVSPQ
jgi:uncharacterized protein YjdB